jgi:lipoprotein-anchoring transpeptidase ErfK/SrfK
MANRFTWKLATNGVLSLGVFLWCCSFGTVISRSSGKAIAVDPTVNQQILPKNSKSQLPPATTPSKRKQQPKQTKKHPIYKPLPTAGRYLQQFLLKNPGNKKPPAVNRANATNPTNQALAPLNSANLANSTNQPLPPLNPDTATNPTNQALAPVNPDTATNPTNQALADVNRANATNPTNQALTPLNSANLTNPTNQALAPLNSANATNPTNQPLPPFSFTNLKKPNNQPLASDNSANLANSTNQPLPPLNPDTATNSTNQPLPPLNPDTATNSTNQALPPLNPDPATNSTNQPLPPLNPDPATNSTNQPLPPLNPDPATNSTNQPLPPLNPTNLTNPNNQTLPPLNPDTAVPELTPPARNIAEEIRLVVKLKARRVVVYQGKKVLTSYPIAVGKPGWETPQGEFQVLNMEKNPIFKSFKTGRIIHPGPENPLGPRWIGIWTDGKTQLGFHGTNQEDLIGKAVSHGCIRMRNRDVLKLYEKVRIGTLVVVEP